MIDRRTFLVRLGFGTVSAAAAILTFDVEKLLWVPGERSIFIPAPLAGGNTLITPELITREVATMWKNQIQFTTKWFGALTNAEWHLDGTPISIRVTHQRRSADWL